MRRAVVAAVAAALCLAALATVEPRPAAAHAVLLESAPADGAALAMAPAAIVLRFNEPVAPVLLRLLGPDGTTTLAGEAVDATLRIALPTLPPGGYLLSYRVTSADSHPVGGAVAFTVGDDVPPVANERDAPHEEMWRWAAATNRALHYAALAQAAGGAFFLLLVLGRSPPPVTARIRRGVGIGAIAGVATAIAGIPLQGGLLTAASSFALLDPALWSAGLASTFGHSAIVAAVCLALLRIGLGLRKPGTLLITAGALGAVGALALTGHAASAPPRWLAAPAVVVHGLAMAFWLGALWPLLMVLGGAPAGDAASVLRRFSRMAFGAVALLIAAGLVLALLQVERPAALVATEYGRLLLAKLVVVALLLALAALNKWRLTPRLGARSADAGDALRRSIGVELALGVVILALTATLGHTPPPRAHAERQMSADAQPYAVAASAGGLMVTVEVLPARAGRNDILVFMQKADGAPLTSSEATLELRPGGSGMQGIVRPLRLAAPGQYRLDAQDIPAPGRWTATIEALISDFDKSRISVELDIR